MVLRVWSWMGRVFGGGATMGLWSWMGDTMVVLFLDSIRDPNFTGITVIFSRLYVPGKVPERHCIGIFTEYLR